jgi:hypothetical protein
MANAAVEKIKNFGLRHGEKVAVTLSSLVFVACLGLAASTKTITTTPDELKAAADRSDQNLSQRIPDEQLAEKIEQEGIVETNFLKEVEDQAKDLLVADDFRAVRPWVIPEPGAGFIRDTPKLIAVTELYAYPGRGGTQMYALDEKGNKIIEEQKEEKPKERLGPARRRRRRSMASARGGMQQSGRQSRLSAADEKELEKQRLEEQRKLSSKLAGSTALTPEEKKKADEEERLAKLAEMQGVPYKEEVKGLRWVVLTGVLDHAKLVENYRLALKNPAVAHPFYKRLNLQRQVQQPDGTWSDWQDVSNESNLKVLDNLTEADEELTPDTVRPPALVDPLAFLKSGFWEKVHIASLVPLERREVAKTDLPGAGMFGMDDDEDGRGRGRGRFNAMSGAAGGLGAGGGMSGSFFEDDDERGRGRRGGGMSGGSMGFGGAEAINYWKSEEPRIMVRALDFTVTPDTTYRYRVQLVVWNPNKGRDDLSATARLDRDKIELLGPWSEPTSPVVMPADVSPYVLASTPPTPLSDTKLRFQVVRFDPQSGVTVPRNVDCSPGDVIGELASARIPSSEGTGTVSRQIDFNSHQILLDIIGKPTPLPSWMPGAPLDTPVVALLVRPDGALIIHNEADDEVNEVRKDTFKNYQREIEESNKERESSMGSGSRGIGIRGGRGGRGGRGR